MTLNRNVTAAIGVGVLLLAGLVYAWTVLQAPIAAAYPEWTGGQLSLTFTLTMIFFCLGGMCGGYLQKKIKPRTIIQLAAVLFLLGFGVSSQAHTLVLLYVGTGVLAGFGSGLAYNAVMGTVSCWFPDKQGVISGILLMGFGMSSFLVGKLYAAFTPSDGGDAWRMSFLLIAGVLCAALLAASFFIKRPDASWQAPASTKAKAAKTSYENVKTAGMLKRVSFWLCFVWATVLTAAGLAVISQGSPLALQVNPGLSAGTVATAVGLLSIFNGIGRIAVGFIFEGAGRFWSMMLTGLFFLVGLGLVVAALLLESFALLVVAFCVVGFAYGNVPPTLSAFSYLFYGPENYPLNYSMLNLNLLIASFGSTIAGAVYDAAGSYVVVMGAAAALVVAGTLLAALIRAPRS